MQIFAKTDSGLKRETNQDSFYTGFLSDNSAIVIVCDGMGGANAGNVASETATNLIFDYINKSYSNKLNRDSLSLLVKNAVASATLSIYNMSKSDSKYSGMGTTAVVLSCRR